MSQLAIDPITDQAVRSSTTSRFSEMSTEDFVRIIFTELSHQDPFSPNDSAALLEQLNSIRSIESNIRLTEQLEQLVTQNQLATGGALVGKFVSGLTEDARRAEGIVIGISRAADQVNLELDSGFRIPMDQLELILDPRAFEQQAAPRTASASP